MTPDRIEHLLKLAKEATPGERIDAAFIAANPAAIRELCEEVLELRKINENLYRESMNNIDEYTATIAKLRSEIAERDKENDALDVRCEQLEAESAKLRAVAEAAKRFLNGRAWLDESRLIQALSAFDTAKPKEDGK